MEMKLQKERIKLGDKLRYILKIQKRIKRLEHKLEKFQKELEKEEKDAGKIKEKIMKLEEKLGLTRGVEPTTLETSSMKQKKSE